LVRQTDATRFLLFRRPLGGAPPAGDAPTLDIPYQQLPAPLQAIRFWAMTQPRYNAARGGEFDYLGEEAAALHAEREQYPVPLGDLPLIVVTGKDAPPGHAALQADLARLSRNGKQVIASSTNHAVPLMDPASVVAAVKDVVTTAWTRRP
jgi:hypothetical protein